jgi:low affinity Fe/Cu permease
MTLVSILLELLSFIFTCIVIAVIIIVPALLLWNWLRNKKIKKNIPIKLLEEVKHGRRKENEFRGITEDTSETDRGIDDVSISRVGIEPEANESVDDRTDVQDERRPKFHRYSPI